MTSGVLLLVSALTMVGVKFTPNGVTEKQVDEIEEYVGRHRSRIDVPRPVFAAIAERSVRTGAYAVVTVAGFASILWTPRTIADVLGGGTATVWEYSSSSVEPCACSPPSPSAT